MAEFVQYVTDGDAGCGAPGDPQWHLCCIAQLPDDEIADYMRKACNVDIKGDNVRELAMEYINGLGT